MRKISLNLGAALAAFVVGIAVANLNLHRQKYPSPESVITNRADVVSVSETISPQGWRGVKVGPVSFRIPVQLRKHGGLGNAGVFRGRVDGQDLYVSYEYGRRAFGEVYRPVGPSRDVMINGRRGVLSVHEMERSLFKIKEDSNIVTLYLPDVGDGEMKFELYAASLDLNTAKRVIGSVEVQ